MHTGQKKVEEMTCELAPGREGRGKHIEKVGTGERMPQTKETVYEKAPEM